MGELLVQHDLVPADSGTPFPDNSTVMVSSEHSMYPWKVKNDGVLVRLTNNDPDVQTPWNGYQASVVVKQAPAVATVIDYQENGPEKTMIMPTVPTAVAYQVPLFDGLTTAGIYPYQTSASQINHKGRTPVELVLSLLCEDENQSRQAVGFHPETYRHDMLIHWLGSAAQEPLSFGVFRNLYRMGQELGGDARKAYMVGLGDGYDVSTATMVKKINERDRPPRSYPYLLGETMTRIVAECSQDFPGLVEQSKRLIAASGFGRPMRTGSGDGYIVPGELAIGPAHYHRVKDALHQAPLPLPKRGATMPIPHSGIRR